MSIQLDINSSIKEEWRILITIMLLSTLQEKVPVV